MTESKTKKERAKEYIGKHKKAIIGFGVIVVLGVVYVFTGVELEYETALEKVCEVTGLC